MQELINKIKKKYELRGLPDSLVEETVKNYFLKKNIQNPKSEKEEKIIIKAVRSELRKYAGQYASKSNIKKRKELINTDDVNSILYHHSSTRERIQDYNLIKKIISVLNPKSILDLGCGINPIALAKQGVRYHAYDINDKDLEVVRDFFNKNNIQGDIHHKDIRKEATFPEVDLCIIFKVLDILGDKKYEITKDLLQKINAKSFLISFATRTLTGKKMNSPYRRWFEKILKQLNYSYDIERTNQEMFYIISKPSS